MERQMLGMGQRSQNPISGKAHSPSLYNEAADQADDRARNELVKHAMSSESDHRLNAMVNLARSEPFIPVRLSDLDQDGWLFNCENGTLDLKTGELQPHSANDLITILVPVEYHQDAQCPRWMSFLDQVTGGKEDLQSYLQRAVGYSLTGDTKSQVIFFPFGLGGNGKSTFAGTIRKLTGEYGERVNTDLFMLKDRNAGGPKEALANLKGKRYVVASELDDGRRLAVSLIKDMTGGETIKADRKYEHEVEYQPTYKIWLVGNHKPTITDTTLSIWRRVKLIPFTVTIPQKDIDPDLPAKLETELPGILVWAVKGCLEWQKHGLNEPVAVTTATVSYRHDQDILHDFIEDCCVIEDTASVAKTDLRIRYQEWCIENSVEPVNQRTFKVRLTEKGITDYKGTGGKRFWSGIRIQTEDEKVADSGKTNETVGTSGKKRQVLPGTLHTKEIQEKSMEKSATLATLPLPPEYTTQPCHNCNGSDYWLREGAGRAEWLCSNCHPQPNDGTDD
jgi:putative DNA primase/helicase